MVKYYYIDAASKQQRGPIVIGDLSRHSIARNTMVWRSGMADWVEAGDVEELRFLFDKNISQPKQNEQSFDKQPSVKDVAPKRADSYNKPESSSFDDIIPMPKNWLIESILISLFCCSPISIVGIFYAAKVESLYYAKDYAMAQEYANKAKLWALIGILFIPACYVVLIIFGSMLGLLFL